MWICAEIVCAPTIFQDVAKLMLTMLAGWLVGCWALLSLMKYANPLEETKALAGGSKAI